MNLTVCFKSWTRRLRGVAGGVDAPCLELVSSLQILTKRLKRALPQRCCQRGHTSLSLMSPDSRQIPSCFAGVVVSYESQGGHSHSFVDGFRFQLRSWPGALFSFTSVSLVMLGSMVWQTTEASSVGFPFQGASGSQLRIVKEMC